MRRPIANNSTRGAIVYDPFLGSGTTLIAAETTDRSCYGIEIDPAYVDVIIRRWQQFTEQLLAFSIHSSRNISGAQYANRVTRATGLDAKGRIEDIAESREELLRLNGDLKHIAYATSRDLQESLRIVVSYTQLLAREYRGKLDARRSAAGPFEAFAT